MPKPKPYRARSLSGAQATVRCLGKQVEKLTALLEQCNDDRKLMARLAADGPSFFNPLEAMAAKQRRDVILREWCHLNPDGSPLHAAKVGA